MHLKQSYNDEKLAQQQFCKAHEKFVTVTLETDEFLCYPKGHYQDLWPKPFKVKQFRLKLMEEGEEEP